MNQGEPEKMTMEEMVEGWGNLYGWTHHERDAVNQGFRIARAEVLEEAAKIVETFIGAYGGCPDCGEATQEEIAEAIRALLKTPAKAAGHDGASK